MIFLLFSSRESQLSMFRLQVSKSMFLVLGLCVGVQLYQVKAEVLSSEDEQRLVSMIENLMSCREIPGLTMTVVKGKEYKIFSKGVANKETGEPVTSKTLFYLGSITQAFTATLLAELTQRSGGVIHFDTPIAKLIGGEFKLSDKTLTVEVTLRDALMHRTGLATGSIARLTGLPQAMSRAEVISHLKELPQQGLFRDDFQINQFMFTLAAYVGEKITGSSWEKLIRSRVLDKLLMSSTTVTSDQISSPDFARSYVSENGVLMAADQKLFDIGPLAPSSTMYSNAEDMIKALKLFSGDPHLLAQVQIPGPILEEIMNPRLLLPLSYRASIDKSSYLWPVPDINVGYGMGFFRNVYRGYQVPWQASNSHGFNSIMWVMPEKNTGIFISINGQKHLDAPLATVQALTSYAADLLLGFDPWVNETTACSFPEPWMKQMEFPDVEFSPRQADFALADYQGTFSNPLLGDLYIRKSKTNSKALTFTMSEVTGELLPEGGNIFRLFLGGKFQYMQSPVPGKHPIPFARLFFDFKGPQCTGLKMPDSIFGGTPVEFVKTQGVKEEL